MGRLLAGTCVFWYQYLFGASFQKSILDKCKMMYYYTIVKNSWQRVASHLFLCVVMAVSLWFLAADRALGSGSPSEESANVVVLHKEDSGRQVQVKSGDVIQVELDGIGGAGYWWYVAKLDTTHVELISEETKATAEKKLGGPVRGIWRFRAKEPGRTELIMKYYRVWEGPENAVDQFSAILNIT